MTTPQTSAPIVVFAYQRPEHIARALKSVGANPESTTSPMTIYCDGPRAKKDRKGVNATRKAIEKNAPAHAKLVFRDQNIGLANSIIEGVSTACDEHGRAIIIEDDLDIAPTALAYLNGALDYYETNETVMHVAAYMFPTDLKLPETFLYREATCWGWATWGSAWQHFDADADKLAKSIESAGRISEFNINDSMFFHHMLRKQAAGEIDSWAIRWYASMFLKGGLSLHPARSLVDNRGFDGTGEHSSVSEVFEVNREEQWSGGFKPESQESHEAVLAMMDFRSDRFLPKEKNWPTLPEGAAPPIRLSTGQAIDLNAPIPSRKTDTAPEPSPPSRSALGVLRRLARKLAPSS